MTIIPESIELLIVRNLLGSSDEKELKELLDWVSLNENNRTEFQEWLELWGKTEIAGPDFEVKQKAAWTRLHSEIDKKSRTTKTRKGIYLSGLLKVAAAVILTAGITWITSQYYQNSRPVRQEITTVFTPLGSRSYVVLPDSSEVWLNAGTTLKYNPSFSPRSRKVYLDGEAYFHVTEDQKRVFEVTTSDVTVRVYGTSFNVKSYKEEGIIETTLIEGKISLAKNSDEPLRKQRQVYLEPNQKATFIKKEGRIALAEIVKERTNEPEQILKSGNILIFNEVDGEKISSWKTGQLVIETESLIDLSTKLARKYDVDFVFENDALKKFKFSGILEDESLEQVLYAMQLTAPIRYRIDGKRVYLNALPGFIDNQ
jgi:transmembrane sensor